MTAIQDASLLVNSAYGDWKIVIRGDFYAEKLDFTYHDNTDVIGILLANIDSINADRCILHGSLLRENALKINRVFYRDITALIWINSGKITDVNAYAHCLHDYRDGLTEAARQKLVTELTEAFTKPVEANLPILIPIAQDSYQSRIRDRLLDYKEMIDRCLEFFEDYTEQNKLPKLIARWEKTIEEKSINRELIDKLLNFSIENADLYQKVKEAAQQWHEYKRTDLLNSQFIVIAGIATSQYDDLNQTFTTEIEQTALHVELLKYYTQPSQELF